MSEVQPIQYLTTSYSEHANNLPLLFPKMENQAISSRPVVLTEEAQKSLSFVKLIRSHDRTISLSRLAAASTLFIATAYYFNPSSIAFDSWASFKSLRTVKSLSPLLLGVGTMIAVDQYLLRKIICT